VIIPLGQFLLARWPIPSRVLPNVTHGHSTNRPRQSLIPWASHCKAAASTLLHSSAPSNLSHPGLVQPLQSVSHHHCFVLLHCTTAVHAVLIILLLLIPFSLGLAHQYLSPHCSLQSCIVSSPLPLTEHHWPQSHCFLTDPHLAFRFPYH
jgi:hypothetical protein